MHDNFEPYSNATLERHGQLKKQLSPIVSTDAGMQIEQSIKQNKNAPLSIHERREPDSNVTSERDSQREKQLSPILSTVEGMQIAESATQAVNASHSIRESLEPGSNAAVLMVPQNPKEPPLKVSILLAIVTFAAFPKYRSTEVRPKSSRKLPMTLKLVLPAATEIEPNDSVASAAEPNSRRPGGRQIAESDEHPQKT
jgi:hypothetical protein